MMSKNKILLEWERPKIINLYLSEISLKGGWDKFRRTLTILLTLDMIIYFALTCLPIEDVGVDPLKIILQTFIIIPLILFVYIIGPYLSRYQKCKYQIRQKYFSIQGSKNIIFHWGKIKNYHFESNEIFPEFQNLCFIANRRKNVAVVPSEVSIEKIKEILKEKVFIDKTKVFKEKILINFTKIDYIYLSIFSIIGAIILVITFKYIIRLGEGGQLILPLLLWFGPGTLGVIILKGFKAFKSKNGMPIAFIFNMISFFIAMTIGLVVIYLRLYKFFN